MSRQKNAGFTLLELMIVVAVIAILAAIAVPSFDDQMIQQRVEGAAEGLVAALQNTKAEAIKRNATVGIVFTPATLGTDLSTWCYGMTPTGATTCVCTVDADATNDCASGSVVASSDFTNITANINTSASRNYSPLRGTGTSGTIKFSAGNNKTLGVTTSTLGRIRICKDSTSTLGSYTDSGACP